MTDSRGVEPRVLGRVDLGLIERAVALPRVAPEPAAIDGLALTPAAVLCLLTPRPEGLGVLLIRKADHLARHAGQLAFPGGKIDAGDPTPLAAALREAEEEVGLRPDQLRVLGASEGYVTGTGFRITPFVATLTDSSFRPRPDPNEVAEAFEAPLDHLLDPANHEIETWNGRWRGWVSWRITWENRTIWGATGAILKALADRVERARGAA